MTAAFNYTMRDYREDRAKLPLELHSDRARGKGQNLQCGKYQLGCTKPFRCEGGQTLEPRPREVQYLHPCRYSKLIWASP